MHKAAQVHRKLVHISSIFSLIWSFLWHVARFAGSYHSHQKALRILHLVWTDMQWIRSMLTHLLNELPILSSLSYNIGWWGNASTSFRIGVIVRHFWGIWSWAQGVQVGPGYQFDIGWAKAVAVEMDLCMVIHYQIKATLPLSVSKLLVWSDNMGIVHVVNKGRSRSLNTNNMLREIFTLLAASALLLHTEYIKSKINIADSLSRGDTAGFLKNFPDATTKTNCCMSQHLQYLLLSA